MTRNQIDSELPIEVQEDHALIYHYQPKIVRTLLSRKPQKKALVFIVLLFIICSVSSVLGWQKPSIIESFSASGTAVFAEHQFYRLVSALFLHSDPGHLLSNLYMLLPFTFLNIGHLVRSFRGGMVMLTSFVAGGAVTNILTLSSYPPSVKLLGISGVVYLVAGFWFANYMLIERRRPLKSRLIRALGVGLVILFPTSFEFTTSYLAHFHGFWIGLIMGGIFFYINRVKIRSYEVYETGIDLSQF